MFQASTEAYMTSSECNDRNYWSVSGYGQVGVSDKRNPKRYIPREVAGGRPDG